MGLNINFFTASTFLLTVTSFSLSFLFLLFGKNRLHRIWGIYNLSVAIWGMGGFLAGRALNPFESMFWWRFSHLGVITIPVFLLHGTLLFCGLRRRVVLLFSYFLALLFIFLLPSSNFFTGIEYRFAQFYYPILGREYLIFLISWIGLVVFSQVILFLQYQKSTSFRRLQIRYLFFGLIVGFSGGITNFLPGFTNIYPFGNLGIILYSSIIAYAVLKYRLLDLSVAITRAGIFVAVYSMVLGIPFLTAMLGKPSFEGYFGPNWWFLPLGLSTFLATVGPFLYLYFDKKAEDRLLREQRGYQNILKGASGGMIRIKDLSRLLNMIVHVVTKAVKLKHASIYLLSSEKESYVRMASRGMLACSSPDLDVHSPLISWLIEKPEPLVADEIIIRSQEDPENNSLSLLKDEIFSLSAVLVVPSFVENRLIGLIILGEKRSKRAYSLDDLAVFSVLANQAALAIENAQFYDEIKQTHEQLFQAEKLATIGTMADGLSHQINNRFHALSLISGDSLDILKTLDASHCNQRVVNAINDVKSGLERIQANVLQGGEVVKGLLKYSRPGEAGFEPVDIRDVITGAIDMVQYKIKLKEFDFVRNIPDGLPKLYGNLTQLQEVFFNMVDNAYDAIKERQMLLKEEGYRGKIKVSVFLDDGLLGVVVSDNGMGVKDKDKKNLFTPFFTTKATARKGTGLGLYVIEKIVAAHNGKLSMDSTYQSGTQFTIILPLAGPRQT